MKIWLFAGGNAMLMILIIWFVFAPKMQDIVHWESDINRFESRYVYAANAFNETEPPPAAYHPYAAYEMGQRNRRTPLPGNERPAVLETVYQATLRHSENSLRFHSYYSDDIYIPGFGLLQEVLIDMEKETSHVLNFLVAMENSDGSIVSADITWRENGGANARVQLSLLFTEE